MKQFEYNIINNATLSDLDDAGKLGWDAYAITTHFTTDPIGFSAGKNIIRHHLKREIFPYVEKIVD